MRRLLIIPIAAATLAAATLAACGTDSAVQSFCGNFADSRQSIQTCMDEITPEEVCDRAAEGNPDAVAAIEFAKHEC